MIQNYICVVIFLSANIAFAQNLSTESTNNYFKIDDRKIIETKWKYMFTLHLESNTVIHNAGEQYEYFLYFRYNNTYQQYLNGSFSNGNWQLVENELMYRFKHIPQFIISSISKKVLVLEFQQTNSKGTYQYHFTKVSSQNAPFLKPPNELPDVNVEAPKPKKEEKKWWLFSKRRKKKRKRHTDKDNLEPYINIEVIGGGFYGGVNPTLRDYIHIKNDGRLIKEYKSKEEGLIVTKRNISRKELESFAEYIVSQDFFKMERVYDCQTEACHQRKKRNPKPIPLRLAVTYEHRRKVVTISVFGKDAQNMQYVTYPPSLDRIIATIQKMSYRLPSS